MAKWRDAAGQHQRVLGKAWTQRGRPREGYLTKQAAQLALDEILADARRGQLLAPARPVGGVTFAAAAAEWLRYIEHDRKRRPSTLRDYRVVVKGGFPRSEERQSSPARAFTSTRFASTWCSRRNSRRGRSISTSRSSTDSSSARSGSTACRQRGSRRRPTTGSPLGRLRRALRRGGWGAVSRGCLATGRGAFPSGCLRRSARGRAACASLARRHFSKRLIHIRRNYVLRSEGVPKSGRVRSVPMIDQVRSTRRRFRWTAWAVSSPRARASTRR